MKTLEQVDLKGKRAFVRGLGSVATDLGRRAQVGRPGKAVPKEDQAALRSSIIQKYDVNHDGVLDLVVEAAGSTVKVVHAPNVAEAVAAPLVGRVLPVPQNLTAVSAGDKVEAAVLVGDAPQALAALPYSWAEVTGELNEQAARTTRSGLSDMRLRLSVLIAVATVDMMGLMMVAPLMPFYALRFNAPEWMIGPLISAFAMALFSVFAISLADLRGTSIKKSTASAALRPWMVRATSRTFFGDMRA